MLHNHFVNCDSCTTRINLRSQIGYFNIPFNIHCPNCLTLIYGKVIINQRKAGIKLEIENAHVEIVDPKSIDKCYSVELSAEFPTRKLYLRGFSIEEYDGTPFLRNGAFYGDGKHALDLLSETMLFAQNFTERWEKLRVYYNLLWNNRGSLLYPKLEKETCSYEHIPVKKIANDLDATVALHQLFLTTTHISKALPPNTLDEYIRVTNLIVSNKEILEKTKKYAGIIFSDFNEIEKKAFKLINDFSKLYEQLIPVITLRNAGYLENIDKEKLGIMTANFEELSDYYAKSYEWILDNLDIIIALNNIISRNDLNECANGKSYSNIAKLGSKFGKLEFYNDSEPFSKPINNLNNRIRNAVQHFDNEIDYTSQKIVFKDKYRGKVNQESMYLIDFADLCAENFSMIIYILELTYQLRKLVYISEGLTPSTVNSEIITNFKNGKIGRNDLCPCGSGKKYKRCCI